MALLNLTYISYSLIILINVEYFFRELFYKDKVKIIKKNLNLILNKFFENLKNKLKKFFCAQIIINFFKKYKKN